MIDFLLGFALITEYPVAAIVLILAAYYLIILFRTDMENRIAAVILPALGGFIPILIVLAYNTAVFGNPISTGYTHSAYPWFQQHQTQGLVGIGWPNPKAMYYMTLHPAMGVFWQSPILIMSLIGIWFMLRLPRYRFEALIAITAFFSLLILYSGFYAWWGAWTFGPRYLVPMLTFMCLPLVFVPRRWFSSVVFLGLVSIMQMFIAVSSRILIPDDFIKRIDQVGYFAYSTIYNYCLPLLLNGEFSKNLGIKLFGLTTWSSLIPPLLIILIITFVFLVKWANIKKFTVLTDQTYTEE